MKNALIAVIILGSVLLAFFLVPWVIGQLVLNGDKALSWYCEQTGRHIEFFDTGYGQTVADCASPKKPTSN